MKTIDAEVPRIQREKLPPKATESLPFIISERIRFYGNSAPWFIMAKPIDDSRRVADNCSIRVNRRILEEFENC